MCTFGAKYSEYGPLFAALAEMGKRVESVDGGEAGLSNPVIRISPDGGGEGTVVYAKQARAARREGAGSGFWSFEFSEREVRGLGRLRERWGDVRIALICYEHEGCGCDIPVIGYEGAIDCIGVSINTKGHKLNVRGRRHGRGLRAFGSGRADKVGGRDNTVSLDRNGLAGL